MEKTLQITDYNLAFEKLYINNNILSGVFISYFTTFRNSKGVVELCLNSKTAIKRPELLIPCYEFQSHHDILEFKFKYLVRSE